MKAPPSHGSPVGGSLHALTLASTSPTAPTLTTAMRYYTLPSLLFIKKQKKKKISQNFNLICPHQVSVLEMDGQFDRLDELIYVESHLSNISTKFYGEITQQLLKHSDFPGSNNGTGLFQTIVGLKIRDLFEQIVASRAATPLEATKA